MRLRGGTLRTLTGLGIAAVLVGSGCSSSAATTAPATAAPATAAPATAAPATAAPASVAPSVAAGPTGTVAYLLPENTTPRWTSQDAPFFQSWMNKLAPNVKVIIDVANGDPQTQLSQAQAALTQGANVLVVTAVDGTQAAQIVKAADAKSVPVIAYTRIINNADVKYMTGDDPYQIGVSLGQWMADHTKQGDTIAVIAGSTTDSFAHLEHDGYFSILKPLFDSGARKMVGDVWTPNWDPIKAHAEMDAILATANNNVQGVLCANDGTAEGAIASLQTHGLAGKIPVTGIDATLASDQLILKGLQGMSVWRSVDELAQYTAQLVVDLMTNQTPPTSFFTSTVNNGLVDIPMKGIPSTVIDATNMQKLIDAKAIDKAALCQGIPAGTGPC
jgi:D-xylose transport system substrate-binding protein